MIVAVDKNWAIGYKSSLLVRIPSDQKFFREATIGKVVVMGRKTLESLPGGQALKNRTNIVLTSDKQFKAKDVIIVHSLVELLEEVKKYNSEEVFVIGGDSVYRQMLPYCNLAHVTKIEHVYQADTYFPNLEEHKEWQLTGITDEQTYFNLEYVFARYEKK